MPPVPVYAVIFAKSMRYPYFVAAPNLLDFIHELERLVMEHGPFELIYRVY